MSKTVLSPERLAVIYTALRSPAGKQKIAAMLTNPIRAKVDFLRTQEQVEYRFKLPGEKLPMDGRFDTINSEPFYIDDDLNDVARDLLRKLKAKIYIADNDQQFVLDRLDVIVSVDGVTMETIKYMAYIVGWFE